MADESNGIRTEGARTYVSFGPADHQELRLETAAALLTQLFTTARRQFSRALADVIMGAGQDETPEDQAPSS